MATQHEQLQSPSVFRRLFVFWLLFLTLTRAASLWFAQWSFLKLTLVRSTDVCRTRPRAEPHTLLIFRATVNRLCCWKPSLDPCVLVQEVWQESQTPPMICPQTVHGLPCRRRCSTCELPYVPASSDQHEQQQQNISKHFTSPLHLKHGIKDCTDAVLMLYDHFTSHLHICANVTEFNRRRDWLQIISPWKKACVHTLHLV